MKFKDTMAKNKKVLIISPHLDDAVLSCSDHILSWKKEGYDITVVTMFSDFGKDKTSTNPFLCGYKSSSAFKMQRKQEDVRAMKLIKTKYKHLDFTDAGFRKSGKNLIYNALELFSGSVSKKDTSLLTQVSKELEKFKDFDSVVSPLGIGRHVDHLITRSIAEKLFANKVNYYVDFPYARNPHNWSLKDFWNLVVMDKSVIKMSKMKRNVLNCYDSQIKALYPAGIKDFSEIVLSPS